MASWLEAALPGRQTAPTLMVAETVPPRVPITLSRTAARKRSAPSAISGSLQLPTVTARLLPGGGAECAPPRGRAGEPLAYRHDHLVGGAEAVSLVDRRQPVDGGHQIGAGALLGLRRFDGVR